ncbi:MAG: aminotransferase class V-fold PLP-dependent enzyme [Anaerolineales bacterium]
MTHPDFLLDPQIHFLNHGSFGACPRPVFETYQNWQRELENQPVEFLGRRITGLMAHARAELGAYLNAPAQNLVYFPNPTTAVNMIAHNLALRPGDEILTTNHEYGAMDRTWRYVCNLMGAKYIQQPIPIPLNSPEQFLEAFWKGVTPRTQAIFLSHITSATALTFPVAEVCARARESGILTIIDGAHAPGQIPLNLQTLGADLYVGACHKWLCAPKGSSFLYAAREVQDWLDPLVVSWGYESDTPSESQFVDYHEWQGTRDPAAFLSVPAAIAYQKENHWHQVRVAAHQLGAAARESLCQLPGVSPLCPQDAFSQMFAIRLPQATDVTALKTRLYNQYRIEVPVYHWQNIPLLRVSVQAYNTPEDLAVLHTALQELL